MSGRAQSEHVAAYRIEKMIEAVANEEAHRKSRAKG